MVKINKNRLAAIDSGGYLTLNKKIIFYLIIGLGVYWIAYLYSAVLSSLVLGALLAYLLIPLVDFFSVKLRLQARLSAWIVFIGFLVFIGSITRFSAPIVVKQINTLARDFQIISQEIINMQPILDEFTDTNIQLDEIIPELEYEINQLIVPSRLFRIIRSATDNLVWLMVTLMTCFYLLIDHKVFMNWIYKITPESLRTSLREINQEINQVWKAYLRGQLLMMLFIGIVSGIGGFAVGLRNALIIGVIAGLLELIPSLGPTITTIIAGATAWTQGSLYLEISNFWFAILVCGIFILIQAIENTILIPKIMSKRMNLHPALVFVAIVSTLALYGVIAGLIVIPVIGSLGIIVRYVFQKINNNYDEGIPEYIE